MPRPLVAEMSSLSGELSGIVLYIMYVCVEGVCVCVWRVWGMCVCVCGGFGVCVCVWRVCGVCVWWVCGVCVWWVERGTCRIAQYCYITVNACKALHRK